MSTLFSFRMDDELNEKLVSLADATQRSKSFLAAEAIQRYIEQEAWQVAEIIEGTRQARELGTISNDEAQAWMASLGTKKRLPRPAAKKQTRF
jgi:predicted transcriptional regulator